MLTSYQFHKVPVTSIKVSPERQRKDVKDVDKLADSISRIGLLHPIVVTRDNELVAGERRFRAFQLLKEELIPVHYLDELNPTEARLIELEENVKRVDLTWKESCLAILDYHELCEEVNEEWSQQKTADTIGLSTGIIVTTNHRNWRHLIQLRTDRAAEEEIRLVFALIADDLSENFPVIYQDMKKEVVTQGLPPEFTFEFGRV